MEFYFNKDPYFTAGITTKKKQNKQKKTKNQKIKNQ